MFNLKKPNLDILFKDLEHPNPNINYQASIDMYRFWPKQAKTRLIKNLDTKDIQLRRKSVKALCCFGTEVVEDIVEKYCSSYDQLSRIACLKVLVLIASKHNLIKFKIQINKVIDMALKDESIEITLAVISLLRQIGKDSVPSLKSLCRDKNLLKAKAAITALIEIPDSSTNDFLKYIAIDSSIDNLIKESALEALNNKLVL